MEVSPKRGGRFFLTSNQSEKEKNDGRAKKENNRKPNHWTRVRGVPNISEAQTGGD